MMFLRPVLAVVAITVLSGHVSPSVDDNNRYLKVTPLRDGVRLAYTVFFGEIPGASERRSIDSNRDGRIDDAEAQRFANQLGAQVAQAVDLEVDGVAQRIHWDVIAPGMGSDAVAAGSFSVDLVAFACGHATGPHTVRVRDQFRIPRPGETEIKIEDSPGVTITRAHVGPADDPTHDFRFAGPGGPLADDGLELQFTATDTTPTVPSGKCSAAAATKPAAGNGLIAGVIVGGALLVGGGLLVLLRRRKAA
jgi:LPXTG-motif cell wall-anchored protein